MVLLWLLLLEVPVPDPVLALEDACLLTDCIGGEATADEQLLAPDEGGPENFGEIFLTRIGVTPDPPKFTLAPYFCDMGRIGFSTGR